MYICNQNIKVHSMTLQMYNKRTLKCKYVMYFGKYIYKVHLKWFGTTYQCTLVMYFTNVRNVVSMKYS
jgi:hypothetical protein